jgi:hypothetical protein
MARFNFNLAGFQVQVQRHAVVSMRALRALAIEDEEAAAPCQAAEVHEPLNGPGWFDSSWDLVTGLDVREGLPGDARLNEWLAVCLQS